MLVAYIRSYGGWLRNPAPVENDAKHPNKGFQHVSTIQGGAGFLPSVWEEEVLTHHSDIL